MARPNVVSLLFFATDQFPEIALPATRFIKRELFARLKKAGVHRIEAVSMVDHNDTHAWLQTLGLERETEPMIGYGKGGESFIQLHRALFDCTLLYCQPSKMVMLGW